MTRPFQWEIDAAARIIEPDAMRVYEEQKALRLAGPSYDQISVYPRVKSAREKAIAVLNIALQPQPDSKSDRIGFERLRQAIIDNTRGHLFWVGENLLNELQKASGYPASEPAQKCELSIEIDGSTVCRRCDYRTFDSEAACRIPGLTGNTRATTDSGDRHGS